MYIPPCYGRKCPPWEINAYFLSFDPFSIHFSFLLFSSSLVCTVQDHWHNTNYTTFLTMYTVAWLYVDVTCEESKCFPWAFFSFADTICIWWRQIKDGIKTSMYIMLALPRITRLANVNWRQHSLETFFPPLYWRLLTFVREEGDVYFIWLMTYEWQCQTRSVWPPKKDEILCQAFGHHQVEPPTDLGCEKQLEYSFDDGSSFQGITYVHCHMASLS